MMDIINESKKYNTFSPVIYPSNDKISPENLPFTEALAKSITTTGVKVLHDAEINGMFVNNEKVKDYKLCTFTKKLVIFTYHKIKNKMEIFKTIQEFFTGHAYGNPIAWALILTLLYKHKD